MSDSTGAMTLSWDEWQREIVRLLRVDLRAELHGMTLEDIDWAAWGSYYTEGKSPRQAIDRALERDV
jgi:hypothetical protein